MNRETPRIVADFNNADREGRIRLNTRGTQDDLRTLGVELRDGINVVLYVGGNFVAAAVVRYSEAEGWVGEIDWNDLKPL